MGSMSTQQDRSVPNGVLNPNPHALYLVGETVKHSIAPPMHNHIATHLQHLPPGTWTFTGRDCATLSDAMALLRAPSCAGAVVTMPYKTTIMPLLDERDDLCRRIGACNGVYRTREGKLRGTNTDWRGIKGCLLAGASHDAARHARRPALIIGAGGASRAAVYALGVEMGCRSIYVINRDEGEVQGLVADVGRMVESSPPTATAAAAAEEEEEKKDQETEKIEIEIMHVRSVAQASQLPRPYYVVGTVPDFEPQTPAERDARAMLEGFLRGSNGEDGEEEEEEEKKKKKKKTVPGKKNAEVGVPEEEADEDKGVFLDMCFNPRVTRQIKLARRYGWRTVEGTEIIGHQIEEQWRLWTGRILTGPQQQEAWAVLRAEAEVSRAINF